MVLGKGQSCKLDIREDMVHPPDFVVAKTLLALFQLKEAGYSSLLIQSSFVHHSLEGYSNLEFE